jgi:hypothetical protein
MINTHCVAQQHLLVQGFTLYTVPAAVCSRLVARALLDDPGHTWAVYCTGDALSWTAHLAEDDPLRAIFAEAAVRSTRPAPPHVICHTQGSTLLVPLTTADVRGVRMRIEAAIALGKAPPAERLEAFSDEYVEREAEKRRRKAMKAAKDQ